MCSVMYGGLVYIIILHLYLESSLLQISVLDTGSNVMYTQEFEPDDIQSYKPRPPLSPTLFQMPSQDEEEPSEAKKSKTGEFKGHNTYKSTNVTIKDYSVIYYCH